MPYNKEERVAFENILEGFNDALVLSKAISVYRPESSMMERTNDMVWRPQPYIIQSFNGQNQTGNFLSKTQLSIPVSMGFSKSVPWLMDAKELRDSLQEGRLGDAAKQRLASDINTAVVSVATTQMSLVVKRTNEASGFDDVALADSIMSEQGVPTFDRYLALSSRDYNNMASNLAGRQNIGDAKALTAYEKARIGMVSGFETYKMDAGIRLAAANATATINGANQYYTPKATSVAVTGETANVDNRFQNINVTVTAGTIKVGDCFTIVGVNALHHITKQDVGQLKTFRVVGIISGAGGTGTIQITPPLVSAAGNTESEKQYKNVSATPASGAVITFLNTVAAQANPFWQKDALEMVAGSYKVPSGAGVDVMRGSTDQGIEIVMQKQYDINNMQVKFRLDVLFGVVCKQPQMGGIILFGQT